jgi:biotin carboxyl carrier protein
MKQYRLTLEDRVFDVKVLDDPRREQVRVEVDGELFTVVVEALAEVTAGEAASAVAPSLAASMPTAANSMMAGSTLTAPLAGVIKSIAVRPGQRVVPHDELLIIEAMKMDNIIRASREGTIGIIHVSEGLQVAYAEPLLDFADEGEDRERN